MVRAPGSYPECPRFESWWAHSPEATLPQLYPDLHPDLVRVATLDGHDRHIDRLQNDKKALDAGVVEARAVMKAAAAELAESDAAIAANKKALHELGRNVEKYEARRTSAERVLESGGGDPEAAQRQVEQVTTILDDFETEQLERMDQADILDTRKATAETALAAATAEKLRLEAAHPGGVTALRAEYHDVLPLREAMYAELDRSIQQKYDGLRERKRYAVVPIVEGHCKACHRVVQSQHLADLKRGLFEACRGCNRWLRVDVDG